MDRLHPGFELVRQHNRSIYNELKVRANEVAHYGLLASEGYAFCDGPLELLLCRSKQLRGRTNRWGRT
jgi:hypothetical protein